MLLEKRAKVGAVDRRGDTCLHIAMRARSKAIVEALLRNPKNSALLYRANKAGETPYALDALHQKTILGQVFGARKLNTNEDSEGMLGYGLYSSALADVLAEPTLTTVRKFELLLLIIISFVFFFISITANNSG